jgi:hypothetical protein
MFNAPKFKQLDIKSNVGIFLKLYVPFANEKEREIFLREKKNSDEAIDEEEEKNEHFIPDAKYQSKPLVFLYTPIGGTSFLF